jgi:pilus assembly protein Flp/PilA
MNTFTRLLSDESGQGMTEYAILVGTLALGAIVTLTAIGGRLRTIFNAVETNINGIPTS